MPEDPPQKGRERERHPGPIHLVLTQDSDIARSIQLAPLSATNTTTKAGVSDEESPGKETQDGCLCEFHQRADTSSSTAAGFQDREIELIPKPERSLKGCRVPKLAFVIRLRETSCPSEDLRDLFAECLRNVPAIAEQVKVEAGFDTFSTLMIVSLPPDLSAYLSQDPAVISLGPIISGNRVWNGDKRESCASVSATKAQKELKGGQIEGSNESITKDLQRSTKDRKSTRLNSSHNQRSRMPSSA